jgi:hypothetical protein
MGTRILSLTNLRFPSNSPDSMTFNVFWGGLTIPVRLSPHRNYIERVRRLAKTEGIMPTATLRFRAPDISSNAVSDFVNDPPPPWPR